MRVRYHSFMFLQFKNNKKINTKIKSILFNENLINYLCINMNKKQKSILLATSVVFVLFGGYYVWTTKRAKQNYVVKIDSIDNQKRKIKFTFMGNQYEFNNNEILSFVGSDIDHVLVVRSIDSDNNIQFLMHEKGKPPMKLAEVNFK